MKRLRWLTLLLLAFPFITAMGAPSGTTVVDSIPIPSKILSATFVDQMDVATECTHVSIEGKTVFDGRRGKGISLISLEDVDRILFFMKDGELTAQVRLRENAETINLTVNENLRAFGKTSWGTFQIRLGDLKSVTMTAS